MDRIEHNNNLQYCKKLLDIVTSGKPVPDQVDDVISVYNHLTDKQRALLLHYTMYMFGKTVELLPDMLQTQIIDNLLNKQMVKEGNE